MDGRFDLRGCNRRRRGRDHGGGVRDVVRRLQVLDEQMLGECTGVTERAGVRTAGAWGVGGGGGKGGVGSADRVRKVAGEAVVGVEAPRGQAQLGAVLLQQVRLQLGALAERLGAHGTRLRWWGH